MRSVLALALCLALPAAAQSKEVKKFLNAAITLYENLEYEKALKQIGKAKAKATGPDDEAKVALLEGVVLADMGQEEKALTAFKTGFGIDLDGKLPVDVSPKVQAVAERARANVRKLLAPALEAQRAEEEHRLAEEKAKQDQLLRQAAEEKRRQDEQAARSAPPPAVSKSGSAGPSARSLFWIPGVVGLASAGVGTYFLVTAGSKYSALVNHTVDQPTASAYRLSGPTDATLGYVFVGVGVAGVVAAVAMLAFGAPPPSSPQVSIVPLQGGAMVSLLLSGF